MSFAQYFRLGTRIWKTLFTGLFGCCLATFW